jgi:hypothetical protein
MLVSLGCASKLQRAFPMCEIEYAGLEFPENAADKCIHILADWKATVSRKSRKPNFDQTLETLRAHSFDVAPSADVAGGVLVSKHGAGAVLVAAAGKGAPAAFAVAPGALVGGQLARLLDRGYQKFIQTPQFELPATVSQLEGIHRFSEELKQWTGVIDLYNEALGTTSDLYQYDRLKGREAVPPVPRRPWEIAAGH